MTPEQIMHEYAGAARRGDFDTAYGFFAEDIVIRIPGRSPMAGEHRGRVHAIRYIETARALAHRGDVEVEVIDMLTSADRFALLVVERFHRVTGTVTISRANVYRVRDGRIAEIWIFESDQYEVDALMAAA